MKPEHLVPKIASSLQFLTRSTSTLTEDDAGFAPTPEMMTAAQALAHVAITVDWFIGGAFVRDDGFSMDFEKDLEEAKACASLADARAMVEAAYGRATSILMEQSTERLLEPLPEGPIMGGLPRASVVDGIVEHTAHHRGALTVYARLLGRVAPMPYE